MVLCVTPTVCPLSTPPHLRCEVAPTYFGGNWKRKGPGGLNPLPWASLPKEGLSQFAVWRYVCHCHWMTSMSLPGAPCPPGGEDRQGEESQSSLWGLMVWGLVDRKARLQGMTCRVAVPDPRSVFRASAEPNLFSALDSGQRVPLPPPPPLAWALWGPGGWPGGQDFVRGLRVLGRGAYGDTGWLPFPRRPYAQNV